MYKVVFTAIDVKEPWSLDGSPPHVKGLRKIYKVGDGITITSNPGRLVLDETETSASLPSARFSPSPPPWRETSPSPGTT